MLHKAKIEGLAIEQKSNAPILLLTIEDTEQTIPIWIGLLEANSIWLAINGVAIDRPMTHDLFRNYLKLRETYVSRVDVCDIKDNTYYAEIHFIAKDETFSMDSRPSDAIAMALRFDAPIYIDDVVIEKSQDTIQSIQGQDQVGEALDKSEDAKKWTDYLKKLNPEDFGKV